jgi:hypothetical protein
VKSLRSRRQSSRTNQQVPFLARALPSSSNRVMEAANLGPGRPLTTGRNGAEFGESVDSSALSALLDAVPQALLLIDSAAIVRHANRAADDLVRDGDVLRVCEGRLIAAHPTDRPRLRRAIDALCGNNGEAYVVLSLRAEAHPLVSLLLWSVGKSPLSGQRLIAVFASVPFLGCKMDGELLRRLYGLTGAEVRLASLIAAGRSLTEIATELRAVDDPHASATRTGEDRYESSDRARQPAPHRPCAIRTPDRPIRLSVIHRLDDDRVAHFRYPAAYEKTCYQSTRQPNLRS